VVVNNSRKIQANYCVINIIYGCPILDILCQGWDSPVALPWDMAKSWDSVVLSKVSSRVLGPPGNRLLSQRS
jgi:hypothetical protein